MSSVNYKNGDAVGYGMSDGDRLSGTPEEKTYTMRARYKMRHDEWNTAKVRLNIDFGLKVDIVNKGALRNAYIASIENGWQADTASKNGWSSSAQSAWTTGYAAYKTALTQAGTVLGQPYATDSEVSTALTNINNAVKTLSDLVKANFTGGEDTNILPQVYFYVPETIYLYAGSVVSGSSVIDNKTFKYFYGVDENGNSDGKNKTLTDAEKGAKVYFAGKNFTPTSVKITVEGAAEDNTTSWTNTNSSALSSITFDGTAFTGTTASSTGKTYTSFPVNTSCTAGAFSAQVASNAYRFLKWTATYVVGGLTYETYAYTICYGPNVQSAVAAARVYNDRGTESDLQQMAWISGIVGSENNGNRYVNPVTLNPMTGMVYSPTNSKNDGGISQDTNGNYHYNGSGSVIFTNKNDDDGDDSDWSVQNVSPLGSLVLDSTRFDNLQYVPNVKIGYLISYVKEGSSSVNRRRFGYYLSDVSSFMQQNSSGQYYILGVDNEQIVTGGSQTTTQSKVYFQGYSDGDHRGTYINGHYDLTNEDTNSKIAREYCYPRLVANETWDKTVTSTQVVAIAGAGRFGVRRDFNDRTSNSNARSVVAVKVTVVDKSSARKNYQDAVSAARQKSWYVDDSDKAYDVYQNSILEMAVNVGHPGRTKTNATVNDALLKTKTSSGTTTAVHLRDGSSADYNGNVGQAIIGTTTESKQYTYGDKVYGYYNNIPGFTASRYSVTYGSTTKTSGVSQDSSYHNYYYIKNANTPTIAWTFYYTPNTYNITYDPDGGTYNGTTEVTKSSVLFQSKYTVGEGIAQAPTRAGCTFMGWKCNADNVVYQPGDTINWTFTQDVTFTAQWHFNIYYTLFNENHDGLAANLFTPDLEIGDTEVDHSVDGSNSNISYEMVIKREDQGTLSINGKLGDEFTYGVTPINEYGEDNAFKFEAGKPYTFSLDFISGEMIGAYGEIRLELLNADGNTITTVISCRGAGSIENKNNVYDAALADSIAAYKLIIKHGSSSGYTEFKNFKFKLRIEQSTEKTNSSIFSERHQYGTTYDWLPTPTRTGYTFVGWYTEPENDKGEYVSVGSKVFSHDVTLYAHWDPNPYSVHFNSNCDCSAGGHHMSGTMEPQAFKYDVSQNLSQNQFVHQCFVTYYDNDGTKIDIDLGSAATTATAPFSYWTMVDADGKAVRNFANGALVDINLTDLLGTADVAENNTIQFNAVWGDFPSVITPTYSKSGYTLIGWSKTKGSTRIDYLVGAQTDPISTDTALYAVWHENKVDSDVTEKNEGINSIDVVMGYDAEGNIKTEKVSLWNDETLAKYITARDNFLAAQNNYIANGGKTSQNANVYLAAEVVLKKAIAALTERTVDTRFVDAFYVKGDSDNTHSVKEINLNWYASGTLNTMLSAYTNATADSMKSAKISQMQATLNGYVKQLAEAFVSKVQAKTSAPVYNVLEKAKDVKAALSASEDITAVNYVVSQSGVTYYCYTNSATPKVYLSVDEMAGDRVCYPTRSDILSADRVNTVLGSATGEAVKANNKLTTASVDNAYSTYLASGLGTTYSADVNGTTYTGAEYYTKKSAVVLEPQFDGNNNGAVKYVISSYDDSYNPNYAATSTLSGEGSKSTGTADSNGNATITIVIDYHVGSVNADGTVTKINAYGDQTEDDVYLKQFHLFRTSAGARNWELPQAGDSATKYDVNDGTYGQADRGSFTYTFELSDTTDFQNGKINTTNVDEIIKLLKQDENYTKMRNNAFQGTKYRAKDANGKDITIQPGVYKYNYDGTGLGYLKWPNTNWSFNYYPKSGSYTYVHLVDRWGNTCDKVIAVGLQDAEEVSAQANTITEAGGSGLATLSFNGDFSFVTDENSTVENDVFSTTGNTVTLDMGSANKSYTLTMTDNATNSSTATFKTDENGLLTLSIVDEAYTDGVYTFSINGKQVNLYADVKQSNVVSVENAEAVEGEPATIKITVKDTVSKVQIVDSEKNTITNSKYVENEDGTRTFEFTRKMSKGDHVYNIRTKIGKTWNDEGKTATFTFTEKEPAQGKLVSAEYEDGLYKITIEGSGSKVRFVSPTGLNRTYSRTNMNVKSVTKDENGNEVWLVSAKLTKGTEYTVKACYDSVWDDENTVTITAQ